MRAAASQLVLRALNPDGEAAPFCLLDAARVRYALQHNGFTTEAAQIFAEMLTRLG